MQREVLKREVDLLLLATLQGGPAHGYRIVELLRERSSGTFELAEGTVYPALHRLEREGLLLSRWEVVSGRRRRIYRLSRRGESTLARRRRQWFELADAMKEVLA
ncbi:MAG TPA: helix-turn-helix transcriptional regulator [Gaiellaceae bacterium]